jgi:hypothetical protein
MIVSSADILEVTGETTYSRELEIQHKGVEQVVRNMTGKSFEAKTYTNELYDGSGEYRLKLNHLPIISVSRVSVDLESVVKIKNTTLSTTTSVKIDSTNATLVIDATTDILPIATYTTLSSLVTAINALSAKGWSAEIVDTVYNDKQTTKLIQEQFDVTSFKTAKDWSYLYMGEPVSFRVIDSTWIEGYFPRGSQNVAVTYTAGSTPDDLTMMVCSLVKAVWDQKSNNTEGLKSWRVGDVEMVYGTIQESNFFMDIINLNKNVSI